MRKLTFLFTILPSFAIFAQHPGTLLDNWSARSPIGKVYMHFDRDSYIAGETAWFKAYLFSDHLPDTISTVLYVELVQPGSGVLGRQVLPVFLSTTNGQFQIPDTIPTGTYTVRAYTATMLNHQHDFIFQRPFHIYGKTAKQAIQNVSSGKTTLIFFPEGGNLVNGVLNSIAFKATNEKGLPINVSGNVLNENLNIVASFDTYHDGMGVFEFQPVPGQKYFAVIEGESGSLRYQLPAGTDNGISLSMIPHPQGSFFELRQPHADPSFRAAYMIGQVQHHTVFRKEFNTRSSDLQGVIDTRKLPSGILQVTFFNSQGQPLAERLCFVNNQEYRLDASLVTDTLSFEDRAANRFSIVMKDTVQGSFSVSVTDAIYSFQPLEENIISSLLLTSDIKGYVHQPSFYFSADNDSIKTATDLLMMTNGWRRFKWTELPALARAKDQYPDPGYITIRGKVTLRDASKPFNDKSLLVYVSAGDTARNVQTVMTDKQGRFKIDSLLFFDRARIMFSDTRGKQSLFIDVEPDKDSLTRKYNITTDIPTWPQAGMLSGNERWSREYDQLLKANGLMLEGITLKSRVKSPQQKVEEEYTRGAFSGDARKVFDLVNSDEGEHYQNVYQYLQAKGFLPGRRNVPSPSVMGEFSTSIYLDEFPLAIELEELSMNKVALIKIFDSFIGEWGNAPGGVIAIYTKKGENMMEGPIKADVISYPGFSIVKEFYSPDYTVEPAVKETDHRITLSWRPDIFINHVNPRIPVPFFNNDRTRSYRVVVQGMTANGKLVFLEKIISN